jgi:hypothetical protein
MNLLFPISRFFAKKQPTTTKIYISGQISGIEETAFEIFEAAEKQLLSNGFAVVNPMKLPHKHQRDWTGYMREDIKALMDCDAIYMLPNWHASRGAKLEYSLAYSLGLKVMVQTDLK